MFRLDSRVKATAVAVALVMCLGVMQASAALVDLTPLAGATNSVGSVVLNALQTDPTAGIIVGDKVFTGFSYSRSPLGDMPDATDVNVLGFRDPDGNFGLTFQGSFIDLPGGGSSDALIRFTVDVDPAALASGLRISDAHLFLGGVGVGDESFFSVDESFLQSGETLNTFVTTLGPGAQQSQLSDVAFFNPLLTRLTVTKDIFALAASNTNQPARATVIDQSFSQEVIPEPATLALAGISGLALLAVRRRG